MKKFFMMAAMAVCTLAANAQVWIGGELGYWRDYDKNNTSVSILPEIGYNLNEDWAIAMKIGYGYEYQGTQSHADASDKTNTFKVAPYARYNALKFGNVTLFTDLGFGFATSKVKKSAGNSSIESDAANSYEVGVKPGIAIAVNDKWGFVSHVGFLGYRDCNDAASGKNAFGQNGLGFSIDNGLTFGAYYNF